MSFVVGDMMSITSQSNVYVNESYQSQAWSCFMSIIGIVKPLPGLGYSDMIADKDSVTWIPAKDFKNTFYNLGALIKVESGADSSDVATAALQVFQEANLSANAYVLKDEIAALHSDPAFGALADFLYMEYAMSIGIMSVGVGLIIFVSVTDREHELACIMARGSSGSQMRKILMGESFSLMILGLIVGATVGVLTAYLFNTLTQPGSSTGPPREMVFTYVSWLLLVVSVASLVVASLIATARAGRMKLAEVLRIRGG
jgi:ABC-type antimicrobial peptide transport system permease subunit